MTELDTLHCNKYTMNSAYIFFDSQKKTKKFMDVLVKLNIDHTSFVVKGKDVKYFGFKVFRIKKIFFKLCVELKGVLE